MSDDSFGGILDSMRGAVTTADQFFAHSIGSAAARGIAGGAKPQNNVGKLNEANSLSRMDNVPENNRYSPASDSKFGQAKPESFESVEMQWLQRLHRFAQIDTSLQAGKVNEGKPQ